MKNNKKVFFKNRVKCFYTEPGNYHSNRLKGYEESTDLEEEDEEDDEEEDGELDPENPEEQGDLS